MSGLRMQKGDELIALMSSVRQARAPGKRPPRWEERCTERMGVFICRCGGAVEGKVDIDSLYRYAISLPGVTMVEVLDFSCSAGGRERIKQRIRESDLDRFVVAGCSPKLVEDMFGMTAMEASISPFMFEIANLREQCAMVHGKEAASEKAKVLLQAAVAKCALLYPPPFSFEEIHSRTVLIVGNGLSAVLAASGVVDQGGKAVLMLTVSPQELSARGESASQAMEPALRKVVNSPMVRVIPEARLESFHGGPGDFQALLDTTDGHDLVECGAVILAMEVEEERINAEGVIGLSELEEMLSRGERVPRSLVFVSSDSGRDRSWQMRAIEAALRIKRLQRESEVTLVLKEVLAFGLCEIEYIKAQSLGVRFVRTNAQPLIAGRHVRVNDLNLGAEIILPADLVVVGQEALPAGTRELSKKLETPIDEKGFFRGSQVKLKPVASIREGVFLCGSATGPKLFSEAVLEASSAASRAMALVSAPYMERGGVVAEIEAEKCSACLTCLRSCPFNAPYIGDSGKAVIDTIRCQGCGICVGICPSKAIQMHCYTDSQLDAQSEALCREVVD